MLTVWSGRSWGQEGLQSWEVTQFEGQSYEIQTLLKFDSLDKWEAASVGVNAAAVFGDLPNFTTAKPLILRGSLQAVKKLV